MTISYTNHAKNIYDDLAALIKAEMPEYSRPGRIIFRDRPFAKDFGNQSFFRIKIVSDEVNTYEVGGRTRAYRIEIYWYRLLSDDINYDKITDTAEHLEQLLNVYRSNSTKWHFCDVESIQYSEPELPDDQNNEYYGFVMMLNIKKGKY